ncbi:UNVERIFIED_CONTAM: hypothetical protein FKN15_031776 [Acipenser sinensis]
MRGQRQVIIDKLAVGHAYEKTCAECGRGINKSDVLTPQQQEQLDKLLEKWQSVFSEHEVDYGRTEAVQHQIPYG